MIVMSCFYEGNVIFFRENNVFVAHKVMMSKLIPTNKGDNSEIYKDG